MNHKSYIQNKGAEQMTKQECKIFTLIKDDILRLSFGIEALKQQGKKLPPLQMRKVINNLSYHNELMLNHSLSFRNYLSKK